MLRPDKPLVAIFLNPTGIEGIRLIPRKPYSDVDPMLTYIKVSDLVEEMNQRLRGTPKGKERKHPSWSPFHTTEEALDEYEEAGDE